MKTNIAIPTSVIEKLKRKAKKLKKTNSLTHTEALDSVARTNGFEHWHEITLLKKPIAISERAVAFGCVMAFDIKDGCDIVAEGTLITDGYIPHLLEKRLKAICLDTPEPDDHKQRSFRERMNDDYKKEYVKKSLIEEYEDFVSDLSFFRLHEIFEDESNTNILDVIEKNCYFSPLYVWIKGELVVSV